MKYRLKENDDHTYTLWRYEEKRTAPNNAELQFWLQYEECINLLKDIQEELGKALRAASEEDDLTGPWLPVGLCVRINDVIKEYEE